MKSIAKRIFIFLVISFFIIPPFAFASVERSVFAGGCFWCLEHDLEGLPGVLSAESGYAGGSIKNPTYENHEGHQESVLVTYDSDKISYKQLLRAYWRNIDPFDFNGQFCDRGDSYKAVIFIKNKSELDDAIESKNRAAKELSVPLRKIEVQIKELNQFWIAEDYHQDYAKLNKLKYNFYRYSCGRDNRLETIWGENKQNDSQWKVLN